MDPMWIGEEIGRLRLRMLCSMSESDKGHYKKAIKWLEDILEAKRVLARIDKRSKMTFDYKYGQYLSKLWKMLATEIGELEHEYGWRFKREVRNKRERQTSEVQSGVK